MAGSLSELQGTQSDVYLRSVASEFFFPFLHQEAYLPFKKNDSFELFFILISYSHYSTILHLSSLPWYHQTFTQMKHPYKLI